MTNKGKGIVVNTSPWIALSVCGQISLLEKFFHDVYIPIGVRDEIMAGGKQGIGIRELEGSPWIKVGEISDVEKIKFLHELERGEAEVIILAKEKGINHVMIDEKIARMQAKILGFVVIGTLGLLLKAKKEGILLSIKPSIGKLLESGIWVKEEIAKGILKDAGEE